MDNKTYAYASDGGRDASADFDLHADNADPAGVVYAHDRFYVVDWVDNKVYAYGDGGARDASAEFALYSGTATSVRVDGHFPNPNYAASGIAIADGRFYVVDRWTNLVYVYQPDTESDGNGGEVAGSTTYEAGQTVTGFSAGYWVPDAISGGHVSIHADGTRIRLDHGGYIEDGRYRYTCLSGDGCEVARQDILSGTIVRSQRGVVPQDAPPTFAVGSGPGDQIYTVGEAIGELTLPTAAGGGGTLTYALSPEVPGLTFDPATRQLTGTPSAEGTYAMTYTATNTDGETGTLGFDVMVQAPIVSVTEAFVLDDTNNMPLDITYVSAHFHVLDSNGSVYAYQSDGQRDESADFDLHRSNDSPTEIVYARGRFYVVDGDGTVYAYRPDGQRDASADFRFHENNRWTRGFDYFDDRFYATDRQRLKVFVYRIDGQHERRRTSTCTGTSEPPPTPVADCMWSIPPAASSRRTGTPANETRLTIWIWTATGRTSSESSMRKAVSTLSIGGTTEYTRTLTIGTAAGSMGERPTAREARSAVCPLGSWTPDAISGGRFELVEGVSTIRLDDGGYFEHQGFRYTCRNSGGCAIDGGEVVSGTIVRRSSSLEATDSRPRFAAGTEPGD